jgi:hypothetical protein
MTLNQINTRLEELREQKTQVKGLETEVYARIVGYYRSVRNWNKGKKEEYGIRLNYSDFGPDRPESTGAVKTIPSLSLVGDDKTQHELLFAGKSKTVSYLYFYRKTCANCPPVAQWLEHSGIEGRGIDVDRESGMHEALRYDITAAPTVVFLDEQGRETGRGTSVSTLENQVGIAAVTGA